MNVKTRQIIFEKTNHKMNYEYIIEKSIYDFKVSNRSCKEIQAIIMHPQTFYEVIKEYDMNKFYICFQGETLRYKGIQILRSTDMEIGQFLIA